VNEITLSQYFDTTGRDDISWGGIKMIKINTPKGDFNVWTKRTEDDSLAFIRNGKSYQLVTNFLVSYLDNTKTTDFIGCYRYEYIDKMLGMNFENEWWTPILKKHNFIPSGFNNFEKVFEMGTTNSMKDRIVTLKNAFILVKIDVNEYRIIKSPLSYHDLDKNIIEAEEGTIETFNFNS
jgi:hypothetical protein